MDGATLGYIATLELSYPRIIAELCSVVAKPKSPTVYAYLGVNPLDLHAQNPLSLSDEWRDHSQ